MPAAIPAIVNDDDRLIDSDYILEKILPVSRVTLWSLRKKGLFPPGLKIAPNRIAWKLSTVREWIATRPAA